MRLVKMACVLALLISIAAGAVRADTNPGIAPIQSSPHGKTYSQWAADWWVWALQIPGAVNPLTDPTGANATQGQSGHVWFLAGSYQGPAVRSVLVPKGTALFFPIYNDFFGAFLNDPPEQRQIAFLRDTLAAQIGALDKTQIFVEIDGVPVKNPAYLVFLLMCCFWQPVSQTA